MAFQLLKLSPRVIAGISNFCIQYNYSSVSFAMLLLAREHKGTPVWASSALASSIFIGSIFGMLSLGVLGDMVGRPLALALTLTIAAVSAVLSALASWGGENEVYLWIAFWRFFLGIGIGGIFPLSAAVAYESTADVTTGETEDGTGSVHAASALFWQIPGHVMVYFMALLFLSLGWSYDVQWRSLLFSGCIPLLLIIPATLTRYFEQRDMKQAIVAEEYGKIVIGERTMGRNDRTVAGLHNNTMDNHAATSGHPTTSSTTTMEKTAGFSFSRAMNDLSSVMGDPRARNHLLGVSLSWFLFDVYVYGVGIFSPKILSFIFHESDSLSGNCWQNIVSTAVTLPVAGISILCLTCADASDLQIVGFLFVSVALIIFALTWTRLKDHPYELFGLFCYMKSSMALFVPSTTFTLPNSLFRKEIRASCNGIAAASGKLGNPPGV